MKRNLKLVVGLLLVTVLMFTACAKEEAPMEKATVAKTEAAAETEAAGIQLQKLSD